MRVRQNQIDLIANNIANADTNGYKHDLFLSRSFGDALISRINDNPGYMASNAIGYLNHGIVADGTHTVYTQGNLYATERSADFAIAGQGFFEVMTPAGGRLIRCSSTYINADRELVSYEGWRFLGNGGSIRIPTDDFTIDKRGRIYAQDGQYIDTLRIVDYEDYTQLAKDENGLLIAGGGGMREFSGQVMQGYLEASNVDLTNELMRMMSASRYFESSQRVIRIMDETLAKTVNEVGRL